MEKGKIKINEILKNEKAVKIIVLAGFAAIFVIFIMDFTNISFIKTNEDTISYKKTDNYTKAKEAEISFLVNKITGKETVTVMISADNAGSLYIIKGVAIVCEEGDDTVTKAKIIDAVSKALGIGVHKISVTSIR